MKKQEILLEKHFTEKELQMLAKFLNMLLEKNIWFFSSNVKKDEVVIKYTD